MIYGVRMLQKSQTTQHPYMEGDTLNLNQMIQHPCMGGDTSNPNKMIQHPCMKETLQTPIKGPNTHIWGETLQLQDIESNDLSKITRIIKGETFQTFTLGDRQPIEALNKLTQQTPNEEDEVLKQLQKTQANISL